MIEVGVDEEHVLQLANILGCKVGSLPSTYLGLPLCLGNSSKALRPFGTRLWKGKERRLAGWKAKSLSIGRRVILIQVVISNLPVYFMSKDALCQL